MKVHIVGDSTAKVVKFEQITTLKLCLYIYAGW